MIDKVTKLLVEVAETAIQPRFRRLTADQVDEKAPGDLVTVADREAEQLISRGLRGILDIAVVGEEAVATDPSLLAALHENACWVVDPIDGTGNFVAGSPEYAVMVALLRDGEPTAGWIVVPETGQWYVTERGSGAFRGSSRINPLAPSTELGRLRGAAPTKRMSEHERTRIAQVGSRFASLGPGTSCGATNYTRILDGVLDFALYQRSLSWDHAAGSLLLAEVGGVCIRPDGVLYRVSDGRTDLLLTAANQACGEVAQAVLWG
ncbi:inositol monophosphatase family protein [Nocardia takedensis]